MVTCFAKFCTLQTLLNRPCQSETQRDRLGYVLRRCTSLVRKRIQINSHWIIEYFFLFRVYCSGLVEGSTTLRRDTPKGLLCPDHDSMYHGEHTRSLKMLVQTKSLSGVDISAVMYLGTQMKTILAHIKITLTTPCVDNPLQLMYTDLHS